jgi:hypothetical protein
MQTVCIVSVICLEDLSTREIPHFILADRSEFHGETCSLLSCCALFRSFRDGRANELGQ